MLGSIGWNTPRIPNPYLKGRRFETGSGRVMGDGVWLCQLHQTCAIILNHSLFICSMDCYSLQYFFIIDL